MEYYLLLTDVDEQDREIVARYANIVDNYELLFQRNILSDIERLVLPVLKKREGLEYGIEKIGNPLEQIASRSEEENYKLLEELRSREKKREKENKLTGMVMVLDRLRDNWRQKDIDKLQKELRLLVAPEFIEKDPFYIELLADQFKIPEEMSVNDISDMRYAKLDAKIMDEGKKTIILYQDMDGYS